MTPQCCTGGTASSRPARRRLSTAAASLLPAAVLVTLPKCPLCLAAWLTVATGIGISATSAALLRGSVILVLVALVAASLIGLRAFGPRPR